MIRILCLAFVFLLTTLWGVQSFAAPQSDEYGFDEGAEKAPVVDSPVAPAATEVESTPSERSVPKLKADKPDRLLGTGLSAVGGFCCSCLGAPIGSLAAYLISGTEINFLRVGLVMAVTFGAAVLMSGLRVGVLIATGTVSSLTNVNAFSLGGSALNLGLSAGTALVTAGAAGATWYFTDGLDDPKAKSAKAEAKTPEASRKMAIAY